MWFLDAHMCTLFRPLFSFRRETACLLEVLGLISEGFSKHLIVAIFFLDGIAFKFMMVRIGILNLITEKNEKIKVVL